MVVPMMAATMVAIVVITLEKGLVGEEGGAVGLAPSL